MTPSTTISLIIATFNRGPRIARTLDSALAQTRSADEVVVVDDCSPDGTGDWVRANYPQVCVVRTERNVQTSGARNWGARHAKGELLIFLDHDDELLPHALETLAGLLRDHPEARAAYADHVYNNTVTGVCFPDHHHAQPAFARLHRIRPLRVTASARVYGSAMYRALLWGNLLQQPWAVYRDCFLSLGGFAENVRYCEDWDLYMRVARRFPVVLTDRVISIHHVEGQNLHLAEGQEQMHVKVLQRQLHEVGWRNSHVQWVLRKRLAMYYKTAGDKARPRSLNEAWRHYLRSFRSWPFDSVVAARTLGWPLRMLLGNRCEPESTA
jgi:glycosyltransferase involved in cell wall biosynthesis